MLDAKTATAVIGALTDKELKLLADDMDSSGLGNYHGFSASEQEAFIANLASKLDAKQFARLTVAFDDPQQIAKVLAKMKDCWLAKHGFFTYCAEKFSGLSTQRRDSVEGDVWSDSTAGLLASLSAPELLLVLSHLQTSKEFLQAVFSQLHI